MSAETVVVGVAILEDQRVLAARRVHPPQAAGRWEFPGGKVEPGESISDCAQREIAEELGCGIAVGAILDHQAPIKAGYTLRVVTASLVSGEPVPHEHDAIRWLGSAELGLVTWLDADLPFLPLVKELLA